MADRWDIVKTVKIGDLCYVFAVVGAVAFVVTVVDPVPGDEAAALSFTTGALGANCTIVETVKRITGCSTAEQATVKIDVHSIPPQARIEIADGDC